MTPPSVPARTPSGVRFWRGRMRTADVRAVQEDANRAAAQAQRHAALVPRAALAFWGPWGLVSKRTIVVSFGSASLGREETFGLDQDRVASRKRDLLPARVKSSEFRAIGYSRKI